MTTETADATSRTARLPCTVLSVDGTFLAVAGGTPLSLELLGHHAARGPLIALDGSLSAIGWVENHGLALLTGMLLPAVGARLPHRSWHVFAGAVHVLLATANVQFWSSSTHRDTVPAGVAATIGHLVRALADARCVVLSRRPAGASAGRVTGPAA